MAEESEAKENSGVIRCSFDLFIDKRSGYLLSCLILTCFFGLTIFCSCLMP